MTKYCRFYIQIVFLCFSVWSAAPLLYTSLVVMSIGSSLIASMGHAGFNEEEDSSSGICSSSEEDSSDSESGDDTSSSQTSSSQSDNQTENSVDDDAAGVPSLVTAGDCSHSPFIKRSCNEECLPSAKRQRKMAVEKTEVELISQVKRWFWGDLKSRPLYHTDDSADLIAVVTHGLNLHLLLAGRGTTSRQVVLDQLYTDLELLYCQNKEAAAFITEGEDPESFLSKLSAGCTDQLKLDYLLMLSYQIVIRYRSIWNWGVRHIDIGKQHDIITLNRSYFGEASFGFWADGSPRIVDILQTSDGYECWLARADLERLRKIDRRDQYLQISLYLWRFQMAEYMLRTEIELPETEPVDGSLMICLPRTLLPPAEAVYTKNQQLIKENNELQWKLQREKSKRKASTIVVGMHGHVNDDSGKLCATISQRHSKVLTDSRHLAQKSRTVESFFQPEASRLQDAQAESIAVLSREVEAHLEKKSKLLDDIEHEIYLREMAESEAIDSQNLILELQSKLETQAEMLEKQQLANKSAQDKIEQECQEKRVLELLLRTKETTLSSTVKMLVEEKVKSTDLVVNLKELNKHKVLLYQEIDSLKRKLRETEERNKDLHN